MKPPDILYIMCDELRAFEVGCYGHPAVRTPNIDGLANRGVRFETAVSNCPVCMPARSIVLSGQYARQCCGMLTNTAWHPREGGWIMPQWPRPGRTMLPEQTLPEALQQAGYQTHAIGKWHVEVWPDVIGFDHYAIPAHQHANSAQWFVRDGGPVYSPPGFGLDHEVEIAVDTLTEGGGFDGGGDRPRFVYLNLSPPHMPLMDAPKKYLEKYAREDVVLRDNVAPIGDADFTRDMYLTYLWDYRYYRDRLPYCTGVPKGYESLDALDLIELHRLYYGLTTWVDDAVGRIISKLQEAGTIESTVIVFTADHGENLASHGRMGKGSPNEESIRIPMVVAGPGLDKGRVSRTVASLVDIAPTLLEVAGAQTPAHFSGRSLVEALCGHDRQGEENAAIFENNGRGCGIRTGSHVVNLPWVGGFSGDQRELEATPDLAGEIAADPWQTGGLQMDDPEVKRLLERLRAWNTETAWKPGEAAL